MCQKENIFKRIFTCLVFFVYSFSILPANEIAYEINQRMDIFEYYINRADLEHDKARWEQIVQEGYFSALIEFENNLLTEQEKDLLKKELDKEKIERYAQWELKISLETKRNEALNLYKNKIREIGSEWLFLDNNGSYTESITEEQIQQAWEQWNVVSDKNKILNEFFIKNGINSDFLLTELDLIAQAEGSRIISGMLYDRDSLKYSTSDEAALAIATKLAEETEEAVNQKTEDLMKSLETQLDIPSIENSSQQDFLDEWTEKVMQNIQQGIALWEEAELNLLNERAEWERNAQEIYLENEEAWINAFYSLQEKKREWQNNFSEKINSGLISWQEKYEELSIQIESARSELERQLSEESQQTNRLVTMYVTTYNQCREILARASQGIESWFTIWQEKYNEIYDYWKNNSSQEEYSKAFTNNELQFNFDISKQEDIDKAKNQIDEWKTGYLNMINDKIKAEINYNLLLIQTENENIKQLEKEYKNTEKQINALPFNPQFSQYEEVRKQYSILTQNLVNIENKINETIKNITMYEKIVQDLENLSMVFAQLDKNNNSETIMEKLGEKKHLFDKELWESSDVLLNAESGWFTFAENAEKKRKESVLQLYQISGTDSGVLSEYTNTLDTEYLKAQSVLEYWKQEQEVLEELNNYIKDNSSSVETMEETMKNLELCSEKYEEKIISYENALALIEKQAENLKSEQQKYQELNQLIEQKKLEVENARSEYQNLLMILNGIKEENIQIKISNILKEIQETENLYLNNKNIFLEYYSKNREYFFAIEYSNYMSLLNSLKDGNENLGIKTIQNLEDIIYKTEEFIAVIDSEENINQDEFLTFINQIAQEEPYAFNILLQTDDLQLIKKTLEYVKAFYQNQIKLRKETIAYLEGKSEDEIWTQEIVQIQSSDEILSSEEENPITQNPTWIELETKIKDLENNQLIRKEQIIQNYQIYRSDYINNKNKVALNNVKEFLDSANYKLIKSKENLFSWVNEALLLAENLEESQNLAFIAFVNSVITMKAAEFFYDGTEIVPENITYNDFMSDINQGDLVELNYYQALWNESQNQYQKIIEKTNNQNPSQTEILSKRAEFAKTIFENFTAQEITIESLYKEKSNEEIEQLINEITILSNQIISNISVEEKIEEISDLLIILEKNRLSKSELQSELTKAEQNILNAETILFDTVEDAEKQLEIINKEIVNYNAQVTNAETVYEELKKSALEKRKAQEKYEWAISIYLDAETDSDTNTMNVKKRLEEAKKQVETYTEAVTILENLSKNKNQITDNEYLKLIEQYESDYEKYYKMLVLKSIIASELAIQEEKTRVAEIEEQVALNSLIKEYNFEETNPIYDLIRIVKTDDDFKIDLAYKTECITINEEQFENEEGNMESYFTKKWESVLVAKEQNTDVLNEYLKADSVIEKTVDGIDKRSFLEEDCKQWLNEILNKEEGYLNDIMLAALHVMTHTQNNQDYLQEHVNVLDNKIFQSSLLPSTEIFHGMTLQDRYNFLRQEVLESAYNRVIKENNGTQDIAKYILYRGTVLAQSESWQTREQSLVENRALNELEKILEKRAKSNRITGNVFSASAATAFAASFFCPWLAVAGTSFLVIALSYYDTEESYTALADQVALLSENKNTLAENKESEKNNQIENWITKNSELKKQKDILEKMKGIQTDSESNSNLNFSSYIAIISDLTKENKILNLDEINNFLTQDIFNKSKAANAKSTIEATELIISYLFMQQNDTLESVNIKAEALRNSQNEAITSFWDSINNHDLENLQEKSKLAFGNWDEIQNINKQINAILKQYDSNVDIRNSSEFYTVQIQENILDNLLKAQKINNQNKINIAELQWKQQLDNLMEQKENWIEQITSVKNLASLEWKKSKEKLNTKYNLWANEFTDKYNQLNQDWTNSYIDLIKTKEAWVLNEYNGSSNLSAEDAVKAYTDKIQKTESLTKENVQTYLDEILNSSELSILTNISLSLDSLAKDSNTQQIFTQRHLTVLSEAEKKAEQAIKEMSKIMEKVASKCASLQYEQELQAQAEGYIERLKMENDGMKEWQENLALNNGYTINGQITRKVIIDATLMNPIKETQIMHKYEYFQSNQMPKIQINKNAYGQQLMLNVIDNQKKLEQWAEKIFGKGFLQNQVKEWQVDRKTAKEGIEEDLKQRENELKTDIDELSELSKIGYEKLTDEQKERIEKLSKEIVTIRDGELGKHIGFAPTLKNNSDPNKTKNDAIEYEGSGQMGLIMLDFQWNNLKASYGLAELSKPGYDKRLWDDRNSSFNAPTLRSTMNVALTIVGNATGQTWLSYLDDALFATMDLGGRYKTAEEIGLELVKTAATAAIGAEMNSASNTLSGLTENISNTTGQIIANTAISAGANYATSVANNAVNSFYIGSDGKLSFNKENFTHGFYSADIIASTVGVGVTGGLNSGLLGYGNSNVNGFNSQQIASMQTLTNLTGGLTSSAVSFAMTGNATFNLVSAYGVGMLEFTVGKDGISSTIGMGGTNISIQNITGAISGIQNAHKNSLINSTTYDKMTLDALRTQWGFGDSIAKNQLDDIIAGTTVIKFDEKGNEVAQSVTEDGQKVIHINTSQNDGFIDLGLTLQHEAHRDGITSDAQSQLTETTSAVLGHTQMALAMASDKLYTEQVIKHISSDTNLQNDINAYMYAATTDDWGAFGSYVNAAYDSSADYWKLVQREDGTYGVKFDFNHSLVDEEGNVLVKNDMDIFDEEGNIIGHKKEMSYSASLGMLLGTYTNYLDNSEKFTENRTNDKAYIGKNTEKYMETQGFTWSTSDGWINTTDPDASIAVNGYTMTLVDLMSGKGVSLEEGFANFNLRDEKNNVIGKASVPYGDGLDRYLAFENMVPQGDLLKAGMFHVDTNGNVLMYGVSSTLPTPSDFGKDYPAIADGTYAFKYDNHYPAGGEPYSALRLFNGDYQNQNFDVSLVTGNNKNNPDYRDNVPGFYFDNEGFLMEKTTNYINYHRSNNNEWLLNERRSGSQGCPITYPSQYWQVLPNTKTNRSVDGYFYINRTLYNYY